MKTKLIVIYVICFLVAFVVTIQMRTVNINKADILRLKTENELRDEVNQWKDAYNNLSSKNVELNKRIEEYRDASNQDESIALMKKELDTANILAGLTPVKGKGVTIVLDESKAREKIALDAGHYDSNVFIISAEDIMTLINELLLNGAEVISVNDQRITSRSSIVAVDPKIQIDGVTIAAPYTIKAIGNPETLASGVYLKSGIIDKYKGIQLDITVTPMEEIIIQDYDASVNLQYTVPYESEVQ